MSKMIIFSDKKYAKSGCSHRKSNDLVESAIVIWVRMNLSLVMMLCDEICLTIFYVGLI